MMRQLNGILALIVISILALVSISPFLTDTMPLTDDGNLHVYRSIILDDAIRDGAGLYPRYVSGLAYGYGASLFNYFPPTSYYPTVLFHAIGFEWVTAWKATMIFYVILAGFGTWLWAKQWVDDTGAYIAAIAYLYAPYTLFDTVTRGSSNEFAGMALLPFALWGFTRLARSGKRLDYLLAIVFYALFIMAHNVMTLYGSLLLVAYCGLLILNSRNQPRALWQLGTAGVFAVLLTTFFWLPALAETDFVKINGVLDNLAFIDVTNTLRGIGDVFALPQTADPSQLQATVPVTFHWILLILAVAGFFLPQPREKIAFGSIFGLHIFLYGVLAVVTFSQLAISADVWQSIRLLQYSQFAWRPMSIGSLALALLAGIGGSYLVRLLPLRIGKATGMSVLTILIVLYSIPWLYRPQIDFAPETVAEAQRYELSSRQPVLSSYGEYLPVQTFESALDPSRFQETTERLLSDETVTVMDLDQSAIRLTATVEVAEPTTLTIDWLYVPGWRVRVDNERVDVMPVGDAGLVGFEIPAGEHRIDVQYAGTRLQQGATIASLITVFLAIFVTLRTRSQSQDDELSASLDVTVLIVFAVIGIALFALKTQIVDSSDNIFRTARYTDGMLQGIEQPLSVNFNDDVRLLGIDSTESVASGGRLDVTFYLALTSEVIDRDYSTLVQLVNGQGIVIAETTSFYPGGLATSNWLPDHYIADRLTLDIPDYTAPVTYDLVVGVYESASGTRLDVLNTDGNPVGVDATVSTLQVERPTTPQDRILSNRLLTANGFYLYDINGFPEMVQVGETVEISGLWQSFNPQTNIEPRIVWADGIETVIESPVAGLPLDEWQIDDIWRGYHRVIVPPTLPPGNYFPRIQVGAETAFLPDPVNVSVPEREFELPDLDETINQGWKNGLMLRGYTVDDGVIRFVWQTDSLIDTSLRLFVQLFDADGNLLVVRDSVPVDNTRPTTGWVTDEVIRTDYNFADAPDNSRLLIGWYDPQTGERVLLDDETADALTIDMPQR